MEKEDYVSLEVAKLLKEKGYNELCNSSYFLHDGNWIFQYGNNQNKLNDENWLSTPTLYDAQKWLRENHNIHLHVLCTSYCKPLNRCDYRCEIFAPSIRQFCDTQIYHTYEETLNEGILNALEFI